MPRPPELPEPVVRRLWQSMAEIYGWRWTSDYGVDAYAGAGRTWAVGLRDLKLDQLAAGVVACRDAGPERPPTLPAFRAMCLGIPSVAALKAELTGRGDDRSTAFARAVWQLLDTFALGRADTDRADRMVREAYDVVRERVLRGEKLPAPPLAIAHQPTPFKPAAPADVERYLDEIAAFLGGSSDANH